jgi:hypothetical protein
MEIQPFRNFILLLLFCFSLLLTLWVSAAHSQPQTEPHLQTALHYFGPQDTERDNHGQHIKTWLNSVGLPQGNPYCAAFVSYCLEVNNAKKPEVRSALASNFIRPNSLKAKDVMYGRKTAKAGAVIIWRKGNTMFGHAGFVLFDWQGATGMTIEGNTTATSGSDVEGVFIRKRTIYPANYFRITNFTTVQY